MKRTFSKSFAAIIVSSALFQMPLVAQVKTNFTPEVRSSDSKPTGLIPAEHKSERNEVDIKMPKKTRGVDRYDKLNVWGEKIPDSFLYYRNLLNQNQKAVYDTAYKALMKNEEEATLPVGVTKEEFYDVMYALQYDNPEAFWWAGNYRYWSNTDGTVTKFIFVDWLDKSEIEEKYEQFWNATSPIIFYASTLPDEMSKIKYIHDYICLSTEYDYAALEAGNTGGKYQTAYSCAVEYKTVCAGYSACFQYYMQNLGIPCTYLSSGGHAWNFIKVNGKYYQMDVTWNDADLIPPYYNLTHEEMQRETKSHNPAALSKKIIDSHPSTGNEMSYIQYFGALYEGSPYSYKELNFYDYEETPNHPEKVKIYKNMPKKLSVIKNSSELKNTIDQIYGYDYEEGTIFKFVIPTVQAKDEIISHLTNENDISWKTYSSHDKGSFVLFELTLGAPKKPAQSSGKSEGSRFFIPQISSDSEDTSNSKNDLSSKSSSTSQNASSSQNSSNSQNASASQKNTSTQTPIADSTKQSGTPSLKIGDKGPAGGIVFYIEGNKAYECSEILGHAEWESAKTLCKKYRGGGKSDWSLPTLAQLNQLYQNLRKTTIVSDDEVYWSSTPDKDSSLAMTVEFYDGSQFTNFLWIENAVRAVRSFDK